MTLTRSSPGDPSAPLAGRALRRIAEGRAICTTWVSEIERGARASRPSNCGGLLLLGGLGLRRGRGRGRGLRLRLGLLGRLERLARLDRGRLGLALARGLVLLPARLGLVGERLLEGLLLLGLVDVLHQHALVLELVTLGLEVQRVVQVLVDLLRLAVLLQQPAQHTHPTDPQHLDRHTRLLRTLPLAVARVPPLALRLRPGIR